MAAVLDDVTGPARRRVSQQAFRRPVLRNFELSLRRAALALVGLGAVALFLLAVSGTASSTAIAGRRSPNTLLIVGGCRGNAGLNPANWIAIR